MAVARQVVVPVQLAEAAAEGDVLLERDLLVAEQRDAKLVEVRRISANPEHGGRSLAFTTPPKFASLLPSAVEEWGWGDMHADRPWGGDRRDL